MSPDVTVLACGGASWARLGSDGRWADLLPDVALAPFQPANMGFAIAWSPHMAGHLGKPVKGIALHAGDAVSRAMREGAPLLLDLAPDLTPSEVAARIARPRGKASLSNHLRKTLRMDPVKLALLMECGQPVPRDPAALAGLIKALPVPHAGPLPMDEAISTAGGIRLEALDQGLMIRAMPGVFAAGEMLDWEAPTGGYLITAALATGLWAGQHAALWARDQGAAAP